MPRFNHAYSFSFEIESEDEDGADLTGADLRNALRSRLDRLTEQEILEACEPFDSFEVEDENEDENEDEDDE